MTALGRSRCGILMDFVFALTLLTFCIRGFPASLTASNLVTIVFTMGIVKRWVLKLEDNVPAEDANLDNETA